MGPVFVTKRLTSSSTTTHVCVIKVGTLCWKVEDVLVTQQLDLLSEMIPAFVMLPGIM